ncbi:metal ABC transporter permease [Salinicola aestuarinus]|uniref:metal ABC transporter permease n=1 Tax=Salinicola aestuarinus TaxID=1949082 RepID=UPI000DA1D77A|nr:metal ABC transporter permease [Salinicola aestuarinus]
MPRFLPLSRPFSRTALVLAIGCLTASLAQAQTGDTPQHLRGTITDVSDGGFQVESASDASTYRVTYDDDTRLAGVSESSLDEIEEGTFIGTANRPGENGGASTALEMVIFPDSMRGTGEGDYPWDTPRGATMNADGGTQDVGGEKLGGSGSGAAMTNGTVTATGGDSGTGSEKLGGSSSGSSMTNGTVDSAQSEGDMMTLTVDYGDGSKEIQVPSDVPTVKVSQATSDDLESGAAVFVAGDMAQDPIPAKVVIVGLDGTIPPM